MYASRLWATQPPTEVLGRLVTNPNIPPTQDAICRWCGRQLKHIRGAVACDTCDPQVRT